MAAKRRSPSPASRSVPSATAAAAPPVPARRPALTAAAEALSFVSSVRPSAPCSRCGGKGKLIKNPCKSCHGSGTIAVKKTLEANVPAGIDDDQGFRLSGMGNAGTNGGPAGDVIVAVTVQPSEVFQRDENNIYVVFPITYSQAVLGDTITVPSIDGKVEVNVPEGTQSGTTFRLRGKGVQYVNGRGRGDMYVKCEVEIPKKLSRTQREALKKFEGTLKEDNYEKRKGFFKKLKDMFNN